MRQKLSEKYYKEREEICEKILFILKLDITPTEKKNETKIY